ncbi:MAG: LysM peptidoglycan-binding domain-containing protein [Anaeromyxobacter sp.]|nr:LysM peptidoglycan-binding domain-containing protein [Anaeromyxobacter sp.]
MRLILLAALLLAAAARAESPLAAGAGGAAPPRPEVPAGEAGDGDEEADVPETGPQAVEIDDQSAELEAMRAAERAAHLEEAPSLEQRAAEAAEGLGLGSPLRDRLEGALARPVLPPPSEARGRIPLIPELDHDEAQLRAEYDIPIDVNDAVVGYIRFFQSRTVRPHFVKWLGRSHRYLERYRQILREEGLPEDTVYLAMIESGFANFAQSRAKAVGPWQFMPATGKSFGLRQDFWVDERRDPEKSARAAARYLKELKGQTGDWRLAWAGYNAGAGTIFKARRKGYQDFWSMAETKGRKILRAETKGYVPKLMAAAIVAKHPEDFGFLPEEIEAERWPDYVVVEIPVAAPLATLARTAAVPERTLVELNPELRRACTPPRPFKLKLPGEAAARFAAAWPAVAPTLENTFDGHVVRRGETLGAIAGRYGVPVQGILELNPGLQPRRLRPGAELLIPLAEGGPKVASAAPRPAPAAARAEAPRQAARAGGAASAGERSTRRVRSGDTLWSIAREHGVELGELCRLNGISDPRRHTLKVGAVLKVAGDRG